MSPARKSERRMQGIGVSGGIAIGPAWLVQVEKPRVPQWEVSDEHIPLEKARFSDAVHRAEEEIRGLKRKAASLPDAAAEEAGLLLDAHLSMLGSSRLVRGVLARIEEKAVNAEQAVDEVVDDLSGQFRALKDSYISARIDDVAAIGNRLLRILLNLPYVTLDAVPAGGIVFAKELSPADSALLDPRHFAGIATVHGGAAGHTAVMARSLGLPAVLGLDPALLEQAGQGHTVVVDGGKGVVILNPSAQTLDDYRARQQAWRDEQDNIVKLHTLPAETKDGTRIALFANLELPRDVAAIHATGADGIGLFRTEFLFMNRATLPSEDEQFEAMAAVVRAMAGKTVTFRTLDIGGDKIAPALGGWMSEATNPALGLRAIRLSLRAPHLLRAQFRAMLRVAALGPVRILLPMVTTAQEVEEARAILRDCYKELAGEGAAIPEKMPPLGVMIEIPAAALSADSLAAVADFFALGTNDLVQYTVAIDRGNDQVAFLYNPLNPAVLRLLEFTIEAASRAGIGISICGEMGADPRYAALLLGLGLREFSVGPAALGRIKQRIRQLDLAAAQAHARAVMDLYVPAQIEAAVDGFNG